MDETKLEYLNPEQPYNNKEKLPGLWLERKRRIQQLPNTISFQVIEQTQIYGSRIYVKSDEDAYKIIRELSLPNITYISILKIADTKGQLYYYFRLFADYFGDVNTLF